VAFEYPMTGHLWLTIDNTGLSLNDGQEQPMWQCADLISASAPIPLSIIGAAHIHSIEARITVGQSEGWIIASLRHIARLLDLTAAQSCALHCDDAPDGHEIDRLARYVGLCMSGQGERRRLHRPDGEHYERGLVSVLIAAYSPRFLRAALDSVDQQTWRKLEIVLCDDCPDEAVASIAAEFQRRSTLPLRYVRNSERLGVRRNYERCFELASGEFCKFLNDDDLLEARCIESMVNALHKRASAHLVTSHRRRIDERGFPLNDQPATRPITREDICIDGISLINALLMLGLNFVGEPSTALFRSSVARVGTEALFEFLEARGRGVADMVLWCKLALRGDCVFLAERLSSFRIHSQQRTQTPGVPELALTAIPELRARWLLTSLHESFPPNVLRTQPLNAHGQPPLAAWQHLPLTLFVPDGQSSAQMISDWHHRRHPFFQQSAP
jgi:hypothetical protein